jgi:uncharacterized circularly permuted ATP-grasp superfamily protein
MTSERTAQFTPDVTELVHELRYVESVYRQNCVEPGEPSSVLEGMQKLLVKYRDVK